MNRELCREPQIPSRRRVNEGEQIQPEGVGQMSDDSSTQQLPVKATLGSYCSGYPKHVEMV